MSFSVISAVSYSFHMDTLCVLYKTGNTHYSFKIEFKFFNLKARAIMAKSCQSYKKMLPNP